MQCALDTHIYSKTCYNRSADLLNQIKTEALDPLAGKHQVDIVIDSGAGGNIPSTVVDCTAAIPEVIRQGLGVLYGDGNQQ